MRRRWFPRNIENCHNACPGIEWAVMHTFVSVFHRTYFEQRWIPAMNVQYVDVAASVHRFGCIRQHPSKDTHRHLLTFAVYALRSMEHFRFSLHYSFDVMIAISICIFCAAETCCKLIFLSGTIFFSDCPCAETKGLPLFIRSILDSVELIIHFSDILQCQ